MKTRYLIIAAVVSILLIGQISIMAAMSLGWLQ